MRTNSEFKRNNKVMPPNLLGKGFRWLLCYFLFITEQANLRSIVDQGVSIRVLPSLGESLKLLNAAEVFLNI